MTNRISDDKAEAPMRQVQGRCPACGAASLFLGEGGHVTCARIECPEPCAADQLLHGEAAAPRRAGDILAALGRRIPETLAKGISRDDYALTPSASEPPVVATASIQLDVTATPFAPAYRCSCGQTTRLISIDSAGAHWHEDDPAVPVPPEAFDRLVRVAMWVSRGQAMARTPDPEISDSYPDTAALFALGALDDAGLLNTYRQAAAEEAPDA